jgi:hypothetical protein
MSISNVQYQYPCELELELELGLMSYISNGPENENGWLQRELFRSLVDHRAAKLTRRTPDQN